MVGIHTYTHTYILTYIHNTYTRALADRQAPCWPSYIYTGAGTYSETYMHNGAI